MRGACHRGYLRYRVSDRRARCAFVVKGRLTSTKSPDRRIQDIQTALQLRIPTTQTQSFDQVYRASCYPQEDPDRRVPQRPGFRELADLLQDLTASVDNFLDEVVVSGLEVEREVIFLRHIRIGFRKRTLDDSLHAEGVGVNADVLVFYVEHVVKTDFELAGVEVLLPP